jgi:hypothetical protein
MATTARLGITLLESAQAQKEITVNEALARIDSVLNGGAIDKDIAVPPVSPANGDVYIVASSPTGTWAGKASQIAYFDQLWRFIIPKEGMMLWVMDEDKHYVFNGTAWQILAAGASASVDALVVEGRLTLTSATAVTNGDVTAATVLYFTPYKGTFIALYDTINSLWQVMSFNQISINIPATTNTNYDVFVFNNSGVATLELVAWTNDTTRATALVLQNGVYVRGGNLSRRYVGSVRTTGVSGQTEDSRAKRFVWNYYNRVVRALLRSEPAVSWNYSATTIRQANANAANQISILVGVLEDTVAASLFANVTNSTSTPRAVSAGIGINTSTSFASAIGSVQNTYPISGQYPIIFATINALPPSVGLTNYVWVEYGNGTDTQTWYGNNSYGLNGTVLG